MSLCSEFGSGSDKEEFNAAVGQKRKFG